MDGTRKLRLPSCLLDAHRHEHKVHSVGTALAHLSALFRRMLVRFALAGSRTKSSLLRVALCGLCLATYLGGGSMTAPASAEPRASTKIAPNDTIELSVTGWAALKGGVVEAILLNDRFTVGRTGKLKLPFIGTLLAAGLTPAELERHIADPLQILRDRPSLPKPASAGFRASASRAWRTFSR